MNPTNLVESTPVKYTVNLDWFEIILTGRLIEYDQPLERYKYQGGKIALARKEGGTKHYQYRYDVYIQNKPFGQICLCPRNTAIMNEDFIQFQAFNNVLYEVGFIDECKQLFKALKWNVRNVTRIDIALDGGGFFDVFDQWKDGEIDKLGKARVNVYQTSKRVITGFDVGSKASNKWLTCYNKTRELDKSNKQYIREMWDKANLKIPENGVERLEMKMRNEELKKIVDFDWQRLDDFEYLASLVRTSFKNFFEFIEVNDDKNVSRKKKIEFIDWESIGGKRLERLSTKQTTEIYRMKQAAKTMHLIYLSTGEKHYSQIATEIAININCLDWYIEKLEYWEKEWRKNMGENKDGLINYEFLPAYRTYENGEQLRLYATKDSVSSFANH